MINEWLDILSKLIYDSFWLAPFIALLAGVLTSVTPCAITSVPLVIGYVGGSGNNDTKRAFKLSLVFASGMAVTFTILGTMASILGKLMGTSSSLWYIALGVLMVLMALQVWEIYNFIPSIALESKKPKKGYIGAFVAGVLGGIFSSPCATPVLVVLLSIVAKEGNITWGLLLLLLYSIGHSVLVIVAGTSIAFVTKLTWSNKYGAFSKVLKYLMGSAIMLIAFYMFYLGF
ncbi:cytochrome c biogenesis protein CcdA [Clostridium tagluense]|uniref:cytochrome c biogenesis CcdA family protein n=1 Tax=Clostridium tagluense TaxID=360422 RepID=UPI001C0AD173|nr:cytochrome c biogenesis protein CcdA [Clostridium tagluense]MBU3126801.1 cytochrome c biogenesis protein CcdA [Clostridium tagluense]MCB2310477.1 cytochrome c biogenesis protein CcdA [Clostridium tagluense]MCB2315357.1 cytochrome c biogenesis protein CcdA [Clostridium tagluense]MCB2320208.1 cytochrome c biogenesis protein CcdA [Clostridium tagluense]MCB2325099.1 cytochrome c biogenesis protein CcdA [Clostridium tagluense]